MVFLYGIIIMLILYTWTGSLYPEGTGYRLDFLGENFTPFVPEMAIFYIFLFFPMLILTLIYFGFLDEEKGYGLGWSIVIMNAIATIIYIIFPVSTYWWRQELLANKIEGNFFADLIYFYYTHETSFNCLPSMHAGMSTICFFTWYQYYKINPTFKRKIIAIIALIIAVGVVLSTLFVKQHYIIDEIAGVALAFAVGMIVFRRSSGWNPSEISNQT
ncbi:MAG: phosphatase PAP2 family protein [Promethearchaeota archaeon]|nr:MAG: phosphatase PAP2 family protein [Candidatus Lokiarchaeota archaeon]